MRVAPRNFVLAGVWLALLVLSWALQTPGSSLGRREIGRLFPEFQRAEAVRVSIERPHAAGVPDAGVSIEIRRHGAASDPGSWVLPEHFDYPAGSTSMGALFDALTSLTNLDLLSGSAASHGDYGLGRDGLVLRVFDDADELLVGLVQGAQATPAAGSGLASYVRILGSDDVYRAPRVGTIPTDPRAWLERRWLAFEPGLVRGLRATEAGATQSWSRGDTERWNRDGAAVSARLMRPLLDRLNACFLDEVTAARPAGRQAELSIVLALQDGTQIEMHFGAPDPEGSCEAWRGADGMVVRFSASTRARILKSLAALRGGR